MVRRFDVASDDGDSVVEVDGNRLWVTIPYWPDPVEHTVEIHEKLRSTMASVEDFAARSEFRVEIGELVAIDENGEEYDAEPVVKMYDARHGGGLVWCLITQEVLWGTARGNHAVLPDGTILRDGVIEQDTLAAARDRLERHPDV